MRTQGKMALPCIGADSARQWGDMLCPCLSVCRGGGWVGDSCKGLANKEQGPQLQGKKKKKSGFHVHQIPEPFSSSPPHPQLSSRTCLFHPETQIGPHGWWGRHPRCTSQLCAPRQGTSLSLSSPICVLGTVTDPSSKVAERVTASLQNICSGRISSYCPECSPLPHPMPSLSPGALKKPPKCYPSF